MHRTLIAILLVGAVACAASTRPADAVPEKPVASAPVAPRSVKDDAEGCAPGTEWCKTGGTEAAGYACLPRPCPAFR